MRMPKERINPGCFSESSLSPPPTCETEKATRHDYRSSDGYTRDVMTSLKSPNSSTGANRRNFLKQTLAATAALSLPAYGQSDTAATASPLSDREFWLLLVEKIANPVLKALGQRQLKEKMPVEAKPGQEQSRRECTYLEAMGRLLSGLAPWLESGPAAGKEGSLRQRYCDLARAGIASGTDPASPDYMNFGTTSQSLVDTAFLVLAICRAPTELWTKLDHRTKENLIAALKATRTVLPGANNWLLFSAMVEIGLNLMGEPWDAMRVDYAVRQHEDWFLGDGTYGDGPHFHWDYYNSFVIHPMLLQIMDHVSDRSATWKSLRPIMLERSQRYAVIQERMISPEGTFPAVGRSLSYRFGAFHLLADISLRNQLPTGLSPEQVRCALTTVMRRMTEAPGTFDSNGWLTIGFAGHQPGIGEPYISTGSCYLCSAAWLPLGLPPEHVFWSGKARPWTARALWSGADIQTDHAIDV